MNKVAPSYRRAEARDLVRVSEIFNENICFGGVTLWERSFSVVEISKLFNEFTSREGAFVVEYQDLIIGWGMIRQYHEKEGYRTTCETSVFFDRSYMNQGFGTDFKKFLIYQCKALGYHHICAKILESNQISIAYNQKLGYSIVGIQKEVGQIAGKWVNVVIMQLLL